MRTTKRFTPAVLRRFEQQGRGTGVFESYRAWHQVTRGDPASRGRSHVLCWHRQQIDLLSDKERIVFLLASMHPELIDVRAQYPLSLEPSDHELMDYGGPCRGLHPGTLALAKQLGIRHPRLSSKEESVPWRPSTDSLIAFGGPGRRIYLVAIAFKLDKELSRKRTCQLLELEREYWRRRSVLWLLITDQMIDRLYGECLERVWCWALHQRLDNDTLTVTAKIIRRLSGQSLRVHLESIAAQLGDMTVAQHAFWQSVWYGRPPIDLRRGWRPHLPVTVMSPADFCALNPVLSGRSAWPS